MYVCVCLCVCECVCVCVYVRDRMMQREICIKRARERWGNDILYHTVYLFGIYTRYIYIVYQYCISIRFLTSTPAKRPLMPRDATIFLVVSRMPLGASLV